MAKSKATKRKLARLTEIVEGEDRFFHDYKAELLDFLKEPESEVRRLALTGLWDYPDDDIVEPLLSVADRDPDEAVRSRAIITMGRIMYEGSVAEDEDGFEPPWLEGTDRSRHVGLSEASFQKVRDYLLGLIGDQGQPLELRRHAVEAISFLDTPDVERIIREAYSDPNPLMKLSSVSAMGRNGDRTWAPVILEELDSDSPTMQLEAVRAAGEAGFQITSPKLIRFAQDADKELRLEALWALGITGGEGVRELLEEYADSCAQDNDIREVAEAALGELEMFESGDLLQEFNGFFAEEGR